MIGIVGSVGAAVNASSKVYNDYEEKKNLLDYVHKDEDANFSASFGVII